MNPLPERTFCMAPLATALYNGRVTVDQYLDNLLSHVTVGGLEHPDDKPGTRSRAHLTTLATADPVCGAFRMWTLNPTYPRLQAKDVAQLKHALLAAWMTGSFPNSKRIGDVDPATPPLVHVIAAVAFRRQQAEQQGRALSLATAPPDETVFDVMDISSLSDDYKSPAIWDRVLRSGWIRQPPTANTPPRAASTRAAGWASIMERGLTSAAASTMEQLSSFLRALRDKAVLPNVAFLHGLLRKGAVTPDRLAVFCDVFPLRRLQPPQHPVAPELTSPNGLLLAAASAPLAEGARCVILEVLLSQGLDPNWIPKPSSSSSKSTAPTTIRSPGIDWREAVDDWYDTTSRASDGVGQDGRETALHFAAGRGEVELSRLLVRHGAKTGTKDGKGFTARERAGSALSPEMDEVLKSGSAKSGWFRFPGIA